MGGIMTRCNDDGDDSWFINGGEQRKEDVGRVAGPRVCTVSKD